jgi:hypothetical protein
MKAFLEKFGHSSQLGTNFQTASAALAEFMYQVHLSGCSMRWCSSYTISAINVEAGNFGCCLYVCSGT